MSKIKITYPNGSEILATVREKEEPEFCKAMLDRLADGPVQCCCYHTLSTGGLYTG